MAATLIRRAGGLAGTTMIATRGNDQTIGGEAPRHAFLPEWSLGGGALEPMLYDEDDDDDDADLDDEDVFADDDNLGGGEDFEDEDDEDMIEGDDGLGEGDDSSEDDDDEDF